MCDVSCSREGDYRNAILRCVARQGWRNVRSTNGRGGRGLGEMVRSEEARLQQSMMMMMRRRGW